MIGDSYWVAGNDGTIFQLDAGSGDVVDQIDLVGFGPMPADGDLWTVDFISNSVFRLDERADWSEPFGRCRTIRRRVRSRG